MRSGISLIIGLLCCLWVNALPAGKVLDKSIDLGAFNKLVVDAHVDIKIVSSKNYRIVPKLLSRPLYTQVYEGTLYICHHERCREPIGAFQSHAHGRPDAHIIVYANKLASISIQGDGNLTVPQEATEDLALDLNTSGKIRLTGKHISLTSLRTAGQTNIKIGSVFSSGLSVQARDSSRVALEGIINLKELDIADRSRVNINWVYACETNIKATDSSQGFLAGVVDDVNMDLQEYASVNTRSLRANRSSSHLQDHSRAQLWAREILTLVADGDSEAKYYSAPIERFIYPRDRARFLFMKDLQVSAPVMPAGMRTVDQCALKPIQFTKNKYRLVQ